MTEKSEFRKAIEQRLADLDAKIDELRDRGEEAEEHVRAGLEEHLKKLNEQREKLLERLLGIRDASGEAWKVLRTGVERAWDDLAEGFSKARSRILKSE